MSLRQIWSVPKSIPAILVYRTMKGKALVDEDLRRAGYQTGAMGLHRALRESRPFRSIFRFRVYRESKWKLSLIRWAYPTIDSLELNVVSGKIGKGFVIQHGYSTVIFARAIGENCTILHNVTIGRGRMINGTDIPEIGDNVSIYTGATIIGGIRIGSNVDVGAGAVVVHDVPDNCVVAGVPAQIVRRKEQGKESS